MPRYVGSPDSALMPAPVTKRTLDAPRTAAATRSTTLGSGADGITRLATHCTTQARGSMLARHEGHELHATRGRRPRPARPRLRTERGGATRGAPDPSRDGGARRALRAARTGLHERRLRRLRARPSRPRALRTARPLSRTRRRT